MTDEQLLSYARAEAAFGSDADEAEYRLALANNDTEALARLEAEAAARVAAVDIYYGKRIGTTGWDGLIRQIKDDAAKSALKEPPK